MQLLFWDIETAGNHPARGELLLVSYALDDGPMWWEEGPDVSPRLRELLADPDIAKVSHSPYDARYALLMGLEVSGAIIDTKAMAHLHNENTPLDLEWLAKRYANIEMDKRLVRGEKKIRFRDDDGALYDLAEHRQWRGSPVWDRFTEYCVRDTEALRELYYGLYELLETGDWVDYWLDNTVPLTRVLARMESRGLPIDLGEVRSLADEMEGQLVVERELLLESGGLPESFNLNSGDQLAAYLFGRRVSLKDALVLGKDEVDALKDCVAGEHEDCDPVHLVDCLPAGFSVESYGRDRVHGHWSFAGRDLAPTPPPVNPITGEVGKRPSTSSNELLFMHAEDEWVRELCTGYRKHQKLLTTYLRTWPLTAVGGRLYGSFNQTGTVTGRLSSASPNLQNIPARGILGKRVRSLFVAPPGKLLVVGDYDQLEMRLFAHYSGDERLTRIFREGLDPHLITAQGIFGEGISPHGEERDIGKTLNYAMGYGAGPRKIAQVLSLQGFATDKETAREYLDYLVEYYARFFRWKAEVVKRAKRFGSVSTLGGRRRRLKGAFSDTANWKAVGYGERQAVNSMIQGTAAEIINAAMVAVEEQMPELLMLAQVHDELVFEYDAPDVMAALAFDDGRNSPRNRLQDIGEMAHGFDLRVPLVFEPHAVRKWSDKGDAPSIADLFEEAGE